MNRSVPAILVGTLGYATSTLVALAFAPLLRAVTSAGGTLRLLAALWPS